MSENSYIAVGDIHGCVDTLSSLLDKIGHKRSTFVFLGDYIDRGPDSRGCIAKLMDFSNDHPCVFLRGNHEDMMLEAVRTGKTELWQLNGCQATLQSYDTDARRLQFIPSHLDFIKSTRVYFETADFFFVHAGLNPGMTIDDAKKAPDADHMFMWDRSYLSSPDVVWEKTVVVGHTPMADPILKDKLINIDTGCVYKYKGFGRLTAICLPERELIVQPCIDIT